LLRAVSDTIEPQEKDQSSRSRSKGKRSGLVVKGGKTPLWVQLALIVAAFVIAVVIVTFVLNMLDQPLNTPRASSGNTFQP
jgi:hypothetical protein